MDEVTRLLGAATGQKSGRETGRWWHRSPSARAARCAVPRQSPRGQGTEAEFPPPAWPVCVQGPPFPGQPWWPRPTAPRPAPTPALRQHELVWFPFKVPAQMAFDPPLEEEAKRVPGASSAVSQGGQAGCWARALLPRHLGRWARAQPGLSG